MTTLRVTTSFDNCLAEWLVVEGPQLSQLVWMLAYRNPIEPFIAVLVPGIAVHGVGMTTQAAVDDLIAALVEMRDELRRDLAREVRLAPHLHRLLRFAEAVLV